MAALGRELRHLQPLVQMGTRLEKYEQELAETRELIDSDDAEMAQEATAEAERLEKSIETLLEQIKPALIPHDPLDDRPAIVEIRGGAGGDEAAIFAADLYRMYTRFAEGRRWRVEVISQSDVQTTYEQLQAARYDFTENVVLTALIAAPLLDSAVAPSGGWKPDATYAQVLTTIPDATQPTKDFIAAVSLIQAQTMTPAQVEAYRTDLEKADISVNPRFGEVVPSDQGPVYFSIGPSSPNWIKPSATSAAPAAAS